MEMDFWGPKAHAAKHLHFHTLQADSLNNSDNHLIMDEYDGDVRAWFPCPFCHAEIEIAMLCCHLQEHCFDLKNAVCPICATNLGKDAVAHFTYHHVHPIKRRKSLKSGLWSAVVSHTREKADRGNITIQETSPDPLSAFLGNIPFAGLNEEQVSSATLDTKSSTNDVEKVKDHEEKRHQAAFVQQLIFSTIF